MLGLHCISMHMCIHRSLDENRKMNSRSLPFVNFFCCKQLFLVRDLHSELC